MSDPERYDPYAEMAIAGMQDFELRGSGLAVPLHFNPDAAFIIRTVLAQESEFTRDAIIYEPGFREVCGDTYPLHRYTGVFSDLRFTFDALGSTLIQTAYKRGTSNVYRRNPNYKIVDKLALLTPAK